MTTSRIQFGIMRPGVCLSNPSVGQRFSPCLSQGRFHAPASSDAVRATSGALSESGTPPRSVAPWQVRAMASLSNRRNQQPGSRQGEVQGHFARLLCGGPWARRKNLRPRGCRQRSSIRPLIAARNNAGIRPTATDRRFDDLLCMFEPFFGSFSDCR